MKSGKPVEPVVVSQYGEMIWGMPDGRGGTHHNEESSLVSVTHLFCTILEDIDAHASYADKRSISKTHDAIVCRGCHRSWIFPNTVKTYGDLRKHFSEFNDHAIPSTLERVGMPV